MSLKGLKSSFEHCSKQKKSNLKNFDLTCSAYSKRAFKMHFHRVLFVLIVVSVKKSRPFNMDPITITPLENETSTTTLEPTIKDILIDFEGQRSPTLQILNGRLSLEDTVDLCEALKQDDKTVVEANEKDIYHYIPVKPKSGSYPTFATPCYGWKRTRCLGVPKPPFDYRCHYWSPFFHFGGDDCKDTMQADAEVSTRKKRETKTIESVTLNGVEAVTVCATFDRIDESSENFEVKAIALPTNEASELRCINWVLSPEGGWFKKSLPKAACEFMNAYRPAPSLSSELNSNEDEVEDMFSDVVKCESTGNHINCIFQSPNVFLPY